MVGSDEYWTSNRRGANKFDGSCGWRFSWWGGAVFGKSAAWGTIPVEIYSPMQHLFLTLLACALFVCTTNAQLVKTCVAKPSVEVHDAITAMTGRRPDNTDPREFYISQLSKMANAEMNMIDCERKYERESKTDADREFWRKAAERNLASLNHDFASIGELSSRLCTYITCDPEVANTQQDPQIAF